MQNASDRAAGVAQCNLLLEAKESLVPEESEDRFAGGVLSQTSMQVQLSYSIAGQMLIEGIYEYGLGKSDWD